MAEALRSAETRNNVSATGDFEWPRDLHGRPMLKVSCCASELIPTVQYGNCSVGPLSVTCFIPEPVANTDQEWKEQVRSDVRRVQEVCEEAVAEERQSLHLLMRSRVQATERA